MPIFYAADAEVRLMVCDLAASVTLAPTVAVGDAAQEKGHAAFSAFSQGSVLREQDLPCLSSRSPLHFLGQHANIPFYLVAVNSTSNTVRSFVPNLPRKPLRGSPAPTNAIDRAIYAAVRFKRNLTNTHNPSIKVEAFLNGDFASHVVMTPKNTSDPSTTPLLILSGKRMARLQEKPWILKSHPAVDLRKDAGVAKQRWDAVANILRTEADSRGCDKQGFRRPTGDYLASLSALTIPQSVAAVDMSTPQGFAVLDILITLGRGRKRGPGSSYVQTPQRSLDPSYTSVAKNAQTQGCVDDGGAAVLAGLGLSPDISASSLLNELPFFPETPRNPTLHGAPPTPFKVPASLPAQSHPLRDSSLTELRLSQPTPQSSESLEGDHGLAAPDCTPSPTIRNISKLIFSRGSGARRKSFLVRELSSPLQLEMSPDTPSKIDSTGRRALHLPSDGSPSRRITSTGTKASTLPSPATCPTQAKPVSGRGRSKPSLIIRLACRKLQKTPQWPFKRDDSSKPRVTSPLKNCVNSDSIDHSTGSAGREERAAKRRRSNTGAALPITARHARSGTASDGESSLLLDQSSRGMTFDFTMPELCRHSAVTYDARDAAAVRQIGRERAGEFSERTVVMGVRYIIPPGAGADGGGEQHRR